VEEEVERKKKAKKRTNIPGWYPTLVSSYVGHSEPILAVFSTCIILPHFKTFVKKHMSET
jgi:hypothetical protein